MKKYVYLTLIILLASLNFNLILKPLSLVTGGTQGVALLINHVTKIRPSIIIFIINITTLILSYFFLSKKTTVGTIYASLIYPLFVNLTSIFQIDLNTVLSVLIAGIVSGITGGLVYKLGFSSGGVSTINLLINKFLKIKVALSNFLVNTIIILMGLISFGFLKCIYSIIIILISSFIINIILGKNILK